MSSSLYRLGRYVTRHSVGVLLVWLALILVGGAGSYFSGGKLDDVVSIPGTEAQEGLGVLSQRFPEFAGVNGVLVFSTTDGSKVAAHAKQIEEVVTDIKNVDGVMVVTDPLAGATKQVNADGTIALANIQMKGSFGKLPPTAVPAMERIADTATQGTLKANLGGNILQITSVQMSWVESLGLVVALVVLVVTFTSLLAAGMPLLTALVGVGMSMLTIMTAAAFIEINSTTPTLALMIGLAVGIDYSLFIISRHRAQLAGGMNAKESIARAVATSGSAVVFAGATVIIALLGLFVAGIPFLTVMGISAAFAVAVAVAVAVTATPALMAVAGERLRPKSGSRAAKHALVKPDEKHTMGARWVRCVTKRPLVTVIIVVGILVTAAIPTRALHLSLPDFGSEPPGSRARVTYDLITDGFGAGYNAPLLVTMDIIRSNDPIGTVNDIGKELAKIPGVAAVPLSTPNRTADLGVVQLVPIENRASDSTNAIIHTIRTMRSDLEQRFGVADLKVTGITAATIDVSHRLGNALLPFGLFVVGISFLLLMVVFRSIAVPIKATIGYLLSVLASFGATVAVFIWGWGAGAFGVDRPGPVISFLPIVLMGVLFGLAMDYEVFLVSRMREDYVHTGDAHRAIRTGYTAGARVVAAAALIMISVFAAFIPHGDAIVKPIAFGLAVGVFIDAFIVRMTLVPAVMQLLGEAAWWLPARLAKRLPAIDVEGASLEHHLEHEDWVETHGEAAIRAEDVRLADSEGVVLDKLSVVIKPGTITQVRSKDSLVRAAFAAALCGRLRPDSGRLVVLGRRLPDEAGYVRAHSRIEVAWKSGGSAPALLVAEEIAPDEAQRLAAANTTVIVLSTEPNPAAGEVIDIDVLTPQAQEVQV